MDRKRNLDFDEIYDEVVLINQQSEKAYEKKLSNIVFMGMGEPLLNYRNVLRAIERITAPDGLAMSPRRITVSTAGVAKMIRQLGDDKVKFKLALSLHAKANDKKRNEIMPINETNNIKALIDALNYYYKMTENEITFEYILFKGFNDSLKDADELVKIYRQVPADPREYHRIQPHRPGPLRKTRPGDHHSTVHDVFWKKTASNARLRRSRGKDFHRRRLRPELANKN